MKVIYLVFHGFAPYNGISKKIGCQMKAFGEIGIDAELCYLDLNDSGESRRIINDKVLGDYGKGFLSKIKKRICYSGLYKYITDAGADFLYIRSYHNANPFLIGFVRKLKASGIKTVMEIPTYPYDDEYRNLPAGDRIRLLFDKIYRFKLAKYLYRIVTYSDDNEIFGVKTILISNGIDFSSIKVKDKRVSDPDNLYLIGVAEIHFWHGFDRVIAGMAEYYSKPHKINVFFNIVGYGADDEMNKLKNMVSENNLSRYVNFAGSQTGEVLDKSFDKADLGIASLGRHRSGISKMKSLKNREYAAHGIPFVYSEFDDDFDDKPYVMKIPANETPVSIECLIAFYSGHDFVPQAIRDSIYPGLSWKVQMQKVVDAVSLS